jgi:drug/metabolite transporter (DMT)-like permease
MVVAWGAFFPVLERLLGLWDIYSATLARQVIGSLVLFAFVLLDRRGTPLPVSIPWGRILALGVVGISFGSLLTSLGVLLSSGLSSAIISTTNPITSALTAALLYREPLGRGLLFGTVLSVIGGLISVLGSKPLGEAHFGMGEALIVLSNVTWTWMSMAAQRWLRGFSQLQITAFTVGAGAVGLLLLLPFIAATRLVEFQIDLGAEALALVLFAGAMPIALGNFCWHFGVSRVGIVVASMYNNLLPAGALAVTVVLGGTFTWQQLAGSAVILAGVFTAQLLALRRKS